MNRIKIFGKVERISDLKFDISSKLKVYMDVEIVSVAGNNFKCLVYNKLCDKLRKIGIGEYIYALGYVKDDGSNNINLVLEDIFF